ncbi:MAG: EAL domain-containing protein [Arcobacter sp.]|uniref:EAL domain-containing protein n=1 Tax=Arcobacter sp. TaxID=1872629 RepID=UPI003AFF6659
MKLSYKSKFLFFHLLSVSILIGFIYTFNNYTNESNIHNITNENYKTTFQNKNKYIAEYINHYKNSLDILSRNKLFTDYINKVQDNENSTQLFLAVLNTSPSAFQIRYIDLEGNEKIKINKNLFSKDKLSTITPKNKLENKTYRDYFKNFIQLKKEEFGVSKIDLNIENGKVSEPKMATIRLAKAVFDKNNNRKGFIVINLFLDNFLNELRHSELFNIYLINNKGQFIVDDSKQLAIYSKRFKTHLLEDKVGKPAAKLILSKEEYNSDTKHAKKIDAFSLEENLTLLFQSKFTKIEENIENKKLQLIYILIFISVLALPLVVRFASTPERLEEKIIKQFITDDLTKLPNLEHLLNDLKEKEFKDSLIVLLNITNDKNIQNIYGFNVSKELLKECTHFFREFIKTDTRFLKVYKIKHNVFAFKYLYKDKKILNQSLNKLQNLLENKEFIILDKYEINIDTAIGVSGIDSLNNDINELKEAEIALDDALELNHDISIYNSSHIENLEKHKSNLDKIKVIKDAILNNDNVLIAFQPIYNNFQGKVEKYEVLVRLKYGDKIFFPDEFLQIAKKIKKYKALTKVIIKKSFEYFDDKDFEFSINLSMEDILDEEIRKYLYEEIVNHNLQNKLVIELVETEAINNYEAFTKFIKEIKRLNCKIAIDDFGSGYSNYDYIIKLSDYIDYLKIDGALITDIDTNKKTQLLVGTLKFLCDSLKIRTIAEYVENKEIFEFIKAMNISYSQGYHIGKPEFELTVNENIEEGKKDLNYF